MTNEESDKSPKSIDLQLSAKVIQHISSGLYRSNASALKELVMNSFDAGATAATVSFFYEMENKDHAKLLRLEVRDNGKGISEDDLEKALTHIGYSLKIEDLAYETADYIDEDNFNRPLVGRLGIGMFAIISACNNFTIFTKQKDEKLETVAKINVRDFENIREKTESMEIYSVGTADIERKETDEEGPYTKFVITEFKPPFLRKIGENISENYIVKNFNAGELYSSDKDDLPRFIEDKFVDFIEHVQKRRSIKSLGQLDQLVWNLSLMLPIQYTREGPIKKEVKFGDRAFKVFGRDEGYFDSLRKRLSSYNFNVFLKVDIEDSQEVENEDKKYSEQTLMKLFRPTLLPSQADIESTFRSVKKKLGHSNGDIFAKLCLKTLSPRVAILKQEELDNEIEKRPERVSAFIYHQNMRIHPYESRLLVHRVYDVAIGEPTDEFLRENVSSPYILWQSTGEVLLDRGFQGALNIDRESLYQASESYQYVYELIKNWLVKVDIETEDDKDEVIQSDRNEAVKSSSETDSENDLKRKNRVPVLEQFKKDQEERITARQEIAENQPTPFLIQKRLDEIVTILNLQRGKVSISYKQGISGTQVLEYQDRLEVVLPEFSKEKELWTEIYLSVFSALADLDLEPVRKKIEDLLYEIYESS